MSLFLIICDFSRCDYGDKKGNDIIIKYNGHRVRTRTTGYCGGEDATASEILQKEPKTI